jgi:hypothetical protein
LRNRKKGVIDHSHPTGYGHRISVSAQVSDVERAP